MFASSAVFSSGVLAAAMEASTALVVSLPNGAIQASSFGALAGSALRSMPGTAVTVVSWAVLLTARCCWYWPTTAASTKMGRVMAKTLSQYWKACTSVMPFMPPSETLRVMTAPTTTTPAQ